MNTITITQDSLLKNRYNNELLEQIEDTIFNLHYWEHYRKMAQIRHYKKFVEVADKNIAKLKEELKELKERREQYGNINK